MEICIRSEGLPALPVLLWLGAWAEHGPQGKPLKKASVTDIARRARMLECGAEIVTRWPEAWYAAMRRHRRPVGVGEVQRVRDAWPGLAVQITRLPNQAWQTRVWDVVDALVGRSHSTSRPLVGRNPRLRQRAPTQKATAEALGVGVAKLQALLKDWAPDERPAGDGSHQVLREVDDTGHATCVPELRTAAGRVRRVISTALVASIAGALKATVSARAAAAVLGCGRGRVGALVSTGLLSADRGGRLLLSEVEALRDRVLSRARPSGCAVGRATEFETLDRIWRLQVPAPATRDFIAAIDAGHIRAFALGGADNWHGIAVSTTDAKAWWTSVRGKDDGTVSLGEAAAALGIKGQVAYELATKGWLPTVTMRIGRRTTRRVPTYAIGEFDTRYVALSALTVPQGIHSHSALGWAQARGLKVITGPRIDGARQYFVERSENATKSTLCNQAG